MPIVADYDGDGRADIARYRPGTSGWYFIKSSEGETSFQFGNPFDTPVPADYDGDGKADVALYRSSTNQWFVSKPGLPTLAVPFGAPGDIPAPGDYDGDGKIDIAIYRPSSTYWWYAASSANGQQRATQFGVTTDKPVPSAYIR